MPKIDLFSLTRPRRPEPVLVRGVDPRHPALALELWVTRLTALEQMLIRDRAEALKSDFLGDLTTGTLPAAPVPMNWANEALSGTLMDSVALLCIAQEAAMRQKAEQGTTIDVYSALELIDAAIKLDVAFAQVLEAASKVVLRPLAPEEASADAAPPLSLLSAEDSNTPPSSSTPTDCFEASTTASEAS